MPQAWWWPGGSMADRQSPLMKQPCLIEGRQGEADLLSGGERKGSDDTRALQGRQTCLQKGRLQINLSEGCCCRGRCLPPAGLVVSFEPLMKAPCPATGPCACVRACVRA